MLPARPQHWGRRCCSRAVRTTETEGREEVVAVLEKRGAVAPPRLPRGQSALRAPGRERDPEGGERRATPGPLGRAPGAVGARSPPGPAALGRTGPPRAATVRESPRSPPNQRGRRGRAGRRRPIAAAPQRSRAGSGADKWRRPRGPRSRDSAAAARPAPPAPLPNPRGPVRPSRRGAARVTDEGAAGSGPSPPPAASPPRGAALTALSPAAAPGQERAAPPR